jgi:hypothetical protein
MTIPVTVLQQRTIADTQADWAQSVPFNQFDPSTGTLLDAEFMTAGTIDASASFENLAPVSAIVNLGVAATIDATAEGIGNVASLTPEAVASVNLGAFQGTFDGTLDFSGPSGTVLPDIMATETQEAIVTPGLLGAGTVTSIAPLLGTGTFDVDVSSYATSTVEGNGNLAVLLHGSVGATLSLQYHAAVPSAGGGGDDDAGVFTADVPIFAPGFLISNLTTTTPQVITLQSQTSGWTGSASFTQFDPALGTLDEILLNVGNTLVGTFAAANLESVPVTVSMTENASMTVATPGDTAGLIANAGAWDWDSFTLGAYDGSTDFSGTSGRLDTFPSFPFTDATSYATLTDGTDLSAFTGAGTIALPVSTAGTSTVTGPSNLLEEITQQTGGTVSVSYVYTPIAEPAASGDGGGTGMPKISSVTGTGEWAANAPGLSFIGGGVSETYVTAKPGETFTIGSGANATINDFSPTAGDKLNLTMLLSGAALTPDLSNLGSFLSAEAAPQNAAGDVDTTLSISGPGGAASVVLANTSSISVLDLVSDNALVLPSH